MRNCAVPVRNGKKTIFLDSVIRRFLNFCYESVIDLSVSEMPDVCGCVVSWCCKLNEKLCCICQKRKKGRFFLDSFIRRVLNFCYESVIDLSVSEVSDVRGWVVSWCCKLNEKLRCTCQKRKKGTKIFFNSVIRRGLNFCYKSVTDLSVSEVSDVRGWVISCCCKLLQVFCSCYPTKHSHVWYNDHNAVRSVCTPCACW